MLWIEFYWISFVLKHGILKRWVEKINWWTVRSNLTKFKNYYDTHWRTISLREWLNRNVDQEIWSFVSSHRSISDKYRETRKRITSFAKTSKWCIFELINDVCEYLQRARTSSIRLRLPAIPLLSFYGEWVCFHDSFDFMIINESLINIEILLSKI